MVQHWTDSAQFYHIYPLGLTGAPERNDFTSSPAPRIAQVGSWLDHIENLGCNAVYLGPLFESASHGYDTADYLAVDRRLGTNDDLARLCCDIHRRGMRVIFDAVFNHVGRDHPWFRDLQSNGEHSRYAGYFSRVDFGGMSPYGDPFSYEGWNGHFNLVKLDCSSPAVRSYFYEAAARWIGEFGIDGLRLDAADCIDREFLTGLGESCRKLKSDFWLMGEIVLGDYRNWAGSCIDSATNYEAYKGLYSSHNDANYFEIAYSLKREFGAEGIYRGLRLYSFVDNHDVNRIASQLHDQRHLYPLHILLFTMPGIPSIYYGSEFGIQGSKEGGSDAKLRPRLTLQELESHAPHKALRGAIRTLSGIRAGSSALQEGSYEEAFVDHRQLGFFRRTADETVLVMVNADDKPKEICVQAEGASGGLDLLSGEHISASCGKIRCTLHPNWGRIIRLERQELTQ